MILTWEELQYRLSHCDECDCEHSNPRPDCSCVCHGPEEPYCEAQVGGMECGAPVAKWGQQCKWHTTGKR